MYIPHSSIDRHSDASISWLLWIMLLWIWVWKYLFETLLSVFLDIYTQKWDCWIIWLFFKFSIVRNTILFTMAVAPFYNPTISAQGSNFSTSSPTLVIFCVFLNFYSSHPNGCEMMYHYGFDLHFSKDKWCWTSF